MCNPATNTAAPQKWGHGKSDPTFNQVLLIMDDAYHKNLRQEKDDRYVQVLNLFYVCDKQWKRGFETYLKCPPPATGRLHALQPSFAGPPGGRPDLRR